MNHSALIDASLLAHGPILGAAILAFLGIANLGERMPAALTAFSNTMRQLRQRIASELERSLAPFFSNLGSNPQPTIEENGGSYTERLINPVGSERLRERLYDFLDGNSEAIGDYQALLHAKKWACFWTKARSWILLVMMIHEVLALGYTFSEKVITILLPDAVLQTCFFSSASLIVILFISVIGVMVQGGRLMAVREKYDEPQT